MTIFIYANNVDTTLAGAISASATSLTLSSSANLPTSIPAGSVFVITLNDRATGQNFEIIYATSVSGATLSGLQRAQEGTAAQSWLANDYAYSAPTAGEMNGFGQLGTDNTWAGNNTFSKPVSVPSATSAGHALNLGLAQSDFAVLAGSAAQTFNVAAALNSNQAVNLGQFVASLGGSGFLQIPVWVSGAYRNFIVQWGGANLSSSGTGNTTAVFSLPVTFPNAQLWAIAGFGGVAPPQTGAFSANPYDSSHVQLSLYTQSAGVYSAVYLSIGY
ncbi:hypothetical protein [Burkholderia pseudomultivorans]|uniref:gp53-like domain-containing protein n=1 Tax=Burkholderia pseudomultivorans TaxID=1207504 RepID=UPI000B10E82C|nr:hypothetical protein [Burkholderia pseudomultivorans]